MNLELNLRDLQIEKERLARANPGLRTPFNAFRSTSNKEALRQIIRAAKRTSGFSSNAKAWEKRLRKMH